MGSRPPFRTFPALLKRIFGSSTPRSGMSTEARAWTTSSAASLGRKSLRSSIRCPTSFWRRLRAVRRRSRAAQAPGSHHHIRERGGGNACLYVDCRQRALSRLRPSASTGRCRAWQPLRRRLAAAGQHRGRWQVQEVHHCLWRSRVRRARLTRVGQGRESSGFRPSFACTFRSHPQWVSGRNRLRHLWCRLCRYSMSERAGS